MDGFGHIPRSGDDWAFFLDVDGTLIDIAPTPEAARASPGTVEMLGRLRDRFHGAVALVTGRRVRDLDRIFAPLRIAAAGLHGIERRNFAGKFVHAPVAHREIERARAALADIETRFPGVLLEDKGDTIAVHYRLAPQYEAEILAELTGIIAGAGAGLEMLAGKMLVELRPPGPNKGSAVLAFMAEVPFAGRVPIFVGDDVTDEDGFRAVNRLGGHSIRVGSERESDATYSLRDTVELRGFLDMILTGRSDARS